MTTHDSDPGPGAAAEAPIAVDPRLVAELGFALRLSRPAPWLRSLLALGQVVDDLLPLMGDWMTRWSSALSYDDTEAPLVHARWTQPEAEAGGPTPTPTVRAQAPAVQASHSVHVRERIRETVVHRPAQTASSAPTAGPAPQATTGQRPIVRGVKPPAADAGSPATPVHPRPGRTRVIEGPPLARPSPAATRGPAPDGPASPPMRHPTADGASPAASPPRPAASPASAPGDARADAPATPTAAPTRPSSHLTSDGDPPRSTAAPAPSVSATTAAPR